MAFTNANTKYGYTREGSSVFSTMREKSFNEIENQPGNNQPTGVKSSASPNVKWISKVVAITIVSLAVISGITVAIVLTQGNDDNGSSVTTGSPTAHSTTTSSTTSGTSSTTSSTTSGTSSTTSSTTAGTNSATSSPTSGTNSATSSTTPGTSSTTSSTTSGTNSTTSSTTSGTSSTTSSTTSGTKSTTSSTTSGTSSTTSSTTSGTSSTTSSTTSGTSSTTDKTADVIWLPWNAWLSCSVTCGTGVHRRYRSCNDTSGICEGNYIETAICTETSCPVYGKWTTWSSWGSCDVTCGGGMQIRTRSCNKTDNTDLDCVGNDNQEKTCSNWNCPDCTQACSIGTLNAECDTCICENNIVTGRVVSKKTGSFISNAFVYSTTAPTTKLTESNITGFFTLNTSCSSSQILIVRDGYVDSIVTIDSNDIEVQMTKIVMPYLTETPRSKYRLTGETVTMCCNASATPGIDYFEWFKDSLLIENGVSTDGRFITLNALATTDSGSYQCRANSPYGAVMSPVADLDIKETPDDFCENALQQKTITLPDDCVQSNTNSTMYEVGECIASSCRLSNSSTEDSCADETYSCCVMSDADIRTVQCTNYELQVVVVKACGCATCISPSLEISGTVVDFENNDPIKYAEVWVDGEYETFTSSSGSFRFDVRTSLHQLTILIDDTFSGQYIAGIKVINLTPDMTGTLNIEIKLFKMNDPIEIDSTVENTLVAGTSDNGSSIVQIEIPSNAFYNADGTLYTGIVSASLTFLDPTNSTLLRSLPGVFQYTDNEGQQGDLDSYGLFNLNFVDSAGQPLELGADMSVYVPSDVGADPSEIKLWILSPATGMWEYVAPDSSSRRRKRRQDHAYLTSDNESELKTERVVRKRRQQYDYKIGDIKYEAYSTRKILYNIDMIRISDQCYVKVLFSDDGSLSVQRRNSLGYVSVLIVSFRNNSMRIVEGFINQYSDCMFAECDNGDAYISAKYYGWYSTTDLFAAEPVARSTVVPYNIIENVLKINTLKSNEGPFFPSLPQCTVSSTNSSYLRFHYGLTLQEWEVQTFFTPVSFSLMPFDKQLNLSQLAWYPERTEGYRACYVKVRLELSDNMGVNKFVLRATSYGGSVSSIAGKILGWREESIQSSISETICIEYKCSGLIDPTFVGNEIDYTRVKLQLDYPDQMECTVSEAPGLVSANPPGTNTAQNGNTGGLYVFDAPIHSGSETGVYHSTSDKKIITNAKSNALKTCESGQTISEDPDPLEGVAITFTCSLGQQCSNWWDCFFI